MRLLLSLISLLISRPIYAENLPLQLLHLPPGFSISIYASSIPDAREMTLGKNNIVFVGTRDKGIVYAVIPNVQNSADTRVIPIATGLNMPNGVAFQHGSLYVAEMKRILRFDNITENLFKPEKPAVINGSLPSQKDHGWRYIRFGPDKKLYVGVGAPCDVCLSDDERFATIMRMNPDGSDFEIYTKGVRNTVGFDWDPITHDLWFTNNGRDWMGDNRPPDQLDYAPLKEMNFGFPYYHGKDVPDPVFGKLFPAANFTEPTFELPAHVAPLGMSFYTGKLFPAEYKNQIFIAEHGSWNRSKKIGYQILAVKIAGEKVTAAKPFIYGWLQGQRAWGRPVDILVMPDGALLISDDFAGVIYRVTYQNPNTKTKSVRK